MSADTGRLWDCERCHRRYPDQTAFVEHLPACVRRHVEFTEPRFRDLPDGRVPRVRDASFTDPEVHSVDGATWSPRTQAEAIDAGLRRGTIPTELYRHADDGTTKVWRRIWRRISGQ